ncbi:hypothetical protein [Mongoliitalea daihaiensis]|uniref:hypothetical protein n=1 Tax=Mongoliitalea daihaiensis TaxID=2782006 RepID=UPI001F334247|nr:hypothetical protein [Mongoliitalea daihaiensis]UJP64295.1 hypothetical protein IPZ59_15995 [Mongoliitalea daihaiensis]
MKNLVKVHLVVICWVLSTAGKAQIVGEVFSTKRYTSHEFWGELAFSDSSRFSFFSYNLFRISHNPAYPNSLFNFSTVNYSLTENFGLAAGGFVSQDGFSPIVAFNYTKISDNWLVSIFPSIEVTRNPNLDVFAFVQFRPKINDRWSLFTQVIANSNFNFRQHNFSEQAIRLGLDYKTFQFGLGMDINQFTSESSGQRQTDWNQHPGLFIRKEF